MAAASGIKNTLQLSAGSITSYSLLYSVPTTTYGVYNVSFTNTNATAVQIRLYIGTSTTGSQNASECFEYQTTIAGYGVFERTGLVVDASKNFIVSANASGVNVNIYGIETSTS
jgi:hypothetical protein